MDQCICPARSRSRQTLEKNILSWALTGTGSVVLIRQVSPLHPAPLLHVREHAHLLFLFGAKVLAAKFVTRKLLDIIVLLSVFLCYIIHIAEIYLSWHLRANDEVAVAML